MKETTDPEDGGAEGSRTPDPHNAIVVLYQLSYDPSQSRKNLEGSSDLSKQFAGVPKARRGKVDGLTVPCSFLRLILAPVPRDPTRNYSSPRTRRPAGVIIDWCHGGSQTISTSASSIPGKYSSFC